MIRWLRSWGISLRLARRGMLRSKGRSLLITSLIGVPVMAMTFMAVAYDTFNLTHEEKMDRAMGRADAAASWYEDRPLDDPNPAPTSSSDSPPPKPSEKTDERLLALLPPGTHVARFSLGGSDVRAKTATGIGRIPGVYLPVGDPITTGMIEVADGTPPASDDQISITQAAADRLGATIGSKVTLLEPAAEYTVTAIVVLPDDLGEFIVFRPGVMLREEAYRTGGSWLVDLPDGVSADVPKLRSLGVGLQLRDEQETVDSGQSGSTLALTTIAIGLVIFEVVLLCGPAFAVGARRRQRELALVAANGGTARQLRRVTQADGIVLGLAGAIGGLVLGVPLAVVAQPFIEQIALNRLAGHLRFYPSALVAAVVLAVFTGLLASLVPAYTAARQNVVAALAGRRGINQSRKRWIVLGVLVTAVGGAVIVLGAFTVRAEIILTGLVLGQLGLVVLTPSLIGLLGRFGRSLPLTARIALRDTARNRSSAAPAISAVMAVVAGSVTLGIYYYSSQIRQEDNYRAVLPVGYAAVNLQQWDEQGRHSIDDAKLAEVTRKATAALPTDRAVEIRTAECKTDPRSTCDLRPLVPPANQCPYDKLPGSGPQRDKAMADPRCAPGVTYWTSGPLGKSAVDDGTNLALLTGASGDDLTRAQAALRAGGVIVSDSRYVHDGRVDLTVDGRDTATTFTLPGYALSTGVKGFGVVVPESVLDAHDLKADRGMLVVATTRMPTTAEYDEVSAAMLDISNSGWAFVESGPGHVDTDISLIVLALASALVTLAATAVVTGLAAADGRADLTTLAAVGASPRVRRFMSLSQSGVIAGLGTVLGLLAGAAGAYAMIFALNRSMLERDWPNNEPLPMVAPWLMVGMTLVVPLIAMLGAGLFTRSRLPIERRG